MKEAPVWGWLEGAHEPVRVGHLRRDEVTGAGAFQYDAAYLAANGRALDPEQLRHRDARRAISIKASDREGVPSIIADAGPDAWGRKVLAQDIGFEPDAFDALVRSADDGAGHLAVGDLEAKPAIEWLDLEELANAIRRRMDGLPTKANRHIDQVLSPDTALGGGKPKATTLRGGFPWIAKFPERGDPQNLPYYEAAALHVAARLGIESATVEVQRLPQGRSVLLVKRFDRLPDGGRLPFASGLTLLGAAAQAIGPERTYLKLAQKLRKWTQEAETSPAALWERLAFNALVGNTDDHPRNHAVLYRDGRWQLSPAFDIVPTYVQRDKVALAMPFLTDAAGRLSAVASAENLVRAAPAYVLPVEEAHARLIDMARRLLAEWPEVLLELEAPSTVAAETLPVLEWASKLLSEAEELSVASLKSQRPKRKGWHWHP